MATRTYTFTDDESAQFDRLVTLGFERQDHFEGIDNSQVVFLHKQEGVELTFHPESYVDDAGREYCWAVEVHGKTAGGFDCITSDAWLTMTEFSFVIEPDQWGDMLSALKSLKTLKDWQNIMHPRLQAAVHTNPRLSAQ
ncbi:hypothetical protein H6F76_03240 [Leptolyngbya sp. FACHB-321]|uniref:hypothetical protein n=1 Tax=Leptolyngbya sp. FACHB-321 TaxID=2692807 RepID=UPI001684B152|nr:hypothetical protein [Leptolyngbya sp. FACHB-321]MBD2034065.1 hypothetical protein [Leptolyngbya sp. FACHB-321]